MAAAEQDAGFPAAHTRGTARPLEERAGQYIRLVRNVLLRQYLFIAITGIIIIITITPIATIITIIAMQARVV